MSYKIEHDSPEAKELVTSIQQQLVTLGWTPSDDVVLAEFVLVMIENQKQRDQINSELRDLVGSDYDESFVDYLFDLVPRTLQRHGKGGLLAGAPAATAPAQNAPAVTAPAPNIFNTPGFNAAAPNSAAAPHKRLRDDADSFTPRGGGNTGRGGRNANRGIRNGRGMGPNMGPMGPGGMPPGDMIGMMIDAVNQKKADPRSLFVVPFAALQAHPSFKRLDPALAAQCQANAIAQVQAFAVMHGIPRDGVVQKPGHERQTKRARPSGERSDWPTRPLSETICKYGVDCSRPACPHSHPSPVATRETGLVLSSEPCEKQLTCTNADCEKSHVSVAQTRPAAAATTASTPTIKCKFGNQCTRPGCTFSHPRDTPCRFGEQCVRPACPFGHPASRAEPAADYTRFSKVFTRPDAAVEAKASQLP